ncbi:MULTISPECIES: DUF2273 domain-containing protein [Cryobacterium]|uniref:DUF2273 domain-containing protein n=1 Tax=Cryobacterium breve TaxID=1259258 RepID=A0ABY2J1D6_9MICO|nr:MULTISPECIES: DUF2273 domain-containing protein [Cryobacterium]TFC94109.1 DUF2273 domain-containing protein [Cryobacterium sp. TmT3-12]TFC98660.1 DUF2273 domain-containing protein [Cryobacterium breve]
MSTATKSGAVFGAVLALTWMVLGFWPFVFVAAAMVVGALGGRIMDGKLSVSNLVEAFRGKRSSS